MLLAVLVYPARLRADSLLNFPRLAADAGMLTGVAIVNPTFSDAQVTITAYGANGTQLAGTGVTNPVTVTIPANQQFSKLTSELFGSSLPPDSAAWFQASSSTTGLTGFFLFLDTSITLLDGADAPVASQKIIFNNVRVDSGYTSELNIVNPGADDAHLTLRLAGTYFPPAPQGLTISAHGAARIDVAAYFSVTDIQPGAYVIVDSDVDVAGMELVRSPSADAYALNARRGGEQLTSLYFLQTSVLGNSKSFLSVVNYSADPVVLTISAYKPDGTLFDSSAIKNNPVARALNAGASMREDIESMFGFFGSNELEGWLQVKSSSSAVNGFVSYGDASTGAVAAVTSPAEGQTRAIFSHLATSSGFNTGLSLLNPGSLAANVRVLALQKNGTVLGVFDTVLQPQQRFKGQLGTADLIPQASSQSGGLIYVKSDHPIYMSSLIGTGFTSVNIPPQIAPDSYNPDAAISTLKLNPPIAIIPPGASQRFTVTGAPSTLTWKVNGTAGGTAATGLISSSGVFSAPKSIPARQVVTITAETSSQSAGASADVLDKTPFLAGLSVIQSVTYLDSLARIYSAELAALASAPAGFNAAAPTGNSQIFELSSSAPKASIALFPGEVISKIIPFKADNGISYLLMAAQTSGRIVRLDPTTKEFKYIVTGLNQPTSLVIDPVSGDLLVVELDKVSTVPKSVLQADLLAPDRNSSNSPGLAAQQFAATAFTQTGAAGIAVDRCTGFVYYSLADQGTIIEYHPAIGTSLIVATGLSNPGQMLGIYRTNVTCPDSFHLLVAERGANRVVLVIPRDGVVTPWVDAPGIADLAFLPDGNPNTQNEGVLLGDYTLEQGGVVYVVPLSALYDSNPANPPETELVEPKTDISISQTHSPDPAIPYQSLTFTITVLNKGPAAATGASLTDTLPSDVSILSASSSQGNCGGARGLVYCNLGRLAVGGSATITIAIAPQYPAGAASVTLTNTAAASSIEVDTNIANNTNTQSVALLVPTAAKFILSGVPTSIASGSPVSISITALDLGGKVVTGYTGRVQFSSSDSSALLPSAYAFQPSDAGTRSFIVTFRSPGSRSLTVQDVDSPSLKGTQTTTVLPAQFSLTSITSTPTPGSPFSITVDAKDALGSIATSYTGKVTFSSSDPSATLPAAYTFIPSDQGSHTFAGGFVLNQIGSQTITVRDAADSTVAGSKTFGVSVVASVASLQITASPASIAAGSPTTLTVQAKDQFGSTFTGYTGTIRFTTADTSNEVGFDGPGLNGYTYQFVPADNGTQSFQVYFYRAGTPFISAADTVTSSITGSASITIAAGAASFFQLTNLPPTVSVGVSNPLTVTAMDTYGNVATGYTGTIRFTSDDTSATLPSTSTLTNGSGNFNVRFGTFTCETFWTLTVDDTVNQFLSAAAPVVVAGPATGFQVEITPASPTAGVFADIKVTARDTCFNIDVGFAGNIVFSSTDLSAQFNGGSTYDFISSDAGVHNFAGNLGARFQATGPQRLTVTSGALQGILDLTVLPMP